MDKETLSNYGWIVICVLVLAVMIALATPFGTFVSDAVKSTTAGLFGVNQNALNSTGLINIDRQEFESCEHDYEVTTTANCTTAGTTTHTCKLCGKTYSEETPAGHTFDNASDMTCNVCSAKFTSYVFTPSDYDAKMGTTTATDANVAIPKTFTRNGTNYKTINIGAFAFQNCKSLTSIDLPDSITRIDQQCFQNCTSLTSIVLGKCTNLTSIKTETFSGCTSLTSIDLPDTLTTISDEAFRNCISLTSIDLPNTLTTIDNSAFWNCTSLTSIDLSDCTSLTDIGPWAFSYCTSLTSIDLPEGITSISRSAFSGCTSLTSINFEGTTAQWQAITFGSSWNKNVPATYVQCSDGQVALS